MLGFFWLFLIAFSLILVRVILNDGGNFQFILSWLKAFFLFFSVYSVYRIYFFKLELFSFFKVVVFLYVINGIANIFSGSFPEQFAFLEQFRGENLSETVGKNPYRNSFVSGSGFYSIGVAYGLIGLFLAHNMSRLRRHGVLIYFSFIFI